MVLIPGNAGNITGWRAVVALVVILGLAGVGVWMKMRPRVISSGTWEIEPGMSMIYSMNATKTSKVGGEFECAGSEKYGVMVLDEANFAVASGGNAANFQKVLEMEGVGKQVIGQVVVMPGKYYVICENMGAGKVVVKYKLVELNN